MPVLTTETLITFRRAFSLASLDRRQPAGTYRLVTEDEEIDGLSFLAFRRAATLLHLPAVPNASGGSEIVPVDPIELAAALEADRQAHSESAAMEGN
ncbi:MAG TPA: hypothetical protein VKS60_21140 [Stellaceae bacterium]|nr:hypothetical protein [Stellaceae bacterium]